MQNENSQLLLEQQKLLEEQQKQSLRLTAMEMGIQYLKMASNFRDKSDNPGGTLIQLSDKFYKWLLKGMVDSKLGVKVKKSDEFSIEEVIETHIESIKNRSFSKSRGELYVISQVYRWWEQCKSEGSRKYHNDHIIEALSKYFKVDICTK